MHPEPYNLIAYFGHRLVWGLVRIISWALDAAAGRLSIGPSLDLDAAGRFFGAAGSLSRGSRVAAAGRFLGAAGSIM